MNTDVRHYLYFTTCQVGRIVCSTLAIAILARFLDPSGLGRWTMLLAAATFAHSLFTNWFQQDPYLRFGKQEWAASHTLTNTLGTRLPMLGAGLAAGLLVSTLFWNPVKDFFHLSRTDGVLAFGYFAALVISTDIQTLLQITGRMDRLALAPALLASLSVLLYGGLWFTQMPQHRVEFSLLGTVLLTVLIWMGIGQAAAKEARWGKGSWNATLAKEIVRYAWPILPTFLLGYLVNWGNQVMIQRTFSSHDVGLYQSAFQVHATVVTLAVPLTTILMPRLIDKHLQDPLAMKRFVHTIAPTLFSLWLLAMVPALVLLPWMFMLVYGASYSDALRPLSALLISTPFCALGQIYTGLFTVQGTLGKIFWIILAMVAVNFTTAWVLIPRDRVALQTIALAFSAGFLVAQFLMFYLQHRVLEEPAGRMASLLLTGLAYSGSQFFLPYGWPRVIAGILGAFILVGVVRWSGTVDKALLDQLFSGRLAPGGRGLAFLLVPRS